MNLAKEDVRAIWDELQPLLRAHYLEIAHYQDIELKPSKADYAALAEAGALRCYTGRIDAALVAYAVFFVRPNLHYSGSLQAYQDVLYLAPDKRRGLAGVRLIRYAEKCLAQDGVQVVHHHAKLKTDFGRLLERIGYEPMDAIWVKRLDRG